jgi:hypothetical protein
MTSGVQHVMISLSLSLSIYIYIYIYIYRERERERRGGESKYNKINVHSNTYYKIAFQLSVILN